MNWLECLPLKFKRGMISTKQENQAGNRRPEDAWQMTFLNTAMKTKPISRKKRPGPASNVNGQTEPGRKNETPNLRKYITELRLRKAHVEDVIRVLERLDGELKSALRSAQTSKQRTRPIQPCARRKS
jgi:hypothetical protein